MISAREALALPSAKLSDSDREASETIVSEIDAYVRANMKRTGCAMPIQPHRLNAAIINEVGNLLRQSGWISVLNKLERMSTISGRPELVGYEFTLRPLDEVYDKKALL